jgi:hypothetical protein
VNVDSNQNIEIPPRYRSFRLLEDEDNSVTDTGTIRLCWTFFISLLILFIDLIFQIESVATAANRWSARRVSFVPLGA